MRGRITLAGVVGVAVSMVAGAAEASIVHYVNPEPGQPGHHAWQFDVFGPSSWLDITLSPQAQTNLPSTSSVGQVAAAFGNLHHPVPGMPGLHALVLADLVTIPLTTALSFGDPVQADPTREFLASTAHVGVGDATNFPEGVSRYIGVLTMDGNYGWIEVVRDDFNLTALSWAYETQPGVAIYAGQIPAPGVLPLLAVAALAGRRRRRCVQ